MKASKGIKTGEGNEDTKEGQGEQRERDFTLRLPLELEQNDEGWEKRPKFTGKFLA